MITYLRHLFKPNYQTLNRVEIQAEAIRHNFNLLQSQQPQAQIIPVLKSNAYGHGLKEICSILNKMKVNIVAIDSLPEAQIAYRQFNGKVLLIGEMPIAAYRYLRWDRTEICVYNSATIRFLKTLGVRAHVHIFVNSGMNREGIKDLPNFWREHSDCWPHLKIVGLCSHLADAEGDGKINTDQQNKFFKDLNFLHQQGVYPNLVHLGNSAGVFTLNDERLTAFRPGLSIYGYNPFVQSSPYFLKAKDLQPALSLISTIVSVQKVAQGELVSYNAGYRPSQDTQIAVIPFGYYEGLDRRLSNVASFEILLPDKIVAAKSAGKICMNMCCLDVGRGEPINTGMEVVLISADKEKINSLENLAHQQGSIIYELLVKIQPNIRRVLV